MSTVSMEGKGAARSTTRLPGGGYVAWLGLLGALAYATPAEAQDGRDELARTRLLSQAEAAFQAGDHTTALDLARRAGEIRMTPSVLLMLAEEHNALGHTLDALAAAERCLLSLEADHHVAQRRQMRRSAERLRDSLRTRVGYVSVQVPTPPPAGLQVRVQGGELVPALWSVPYPALPGIVTVEANAGAMTFRREMTLAAGRTETVVIALTTPPVVATPPIVPPVVDPPQPVVEPAPAPVLRTSAPVTEAPPTHEAPAPRGPGAAPWIVAGTGVAVLGAGLVFFLMRNGAIDERDAACAPDTECSDNAFTTAQGHHDRAVTYNTVSNVALGVGAAAVVGGAVWYFVARPGRSAPSRTALRWYVTPTADGASLGLGGTL